MTDGYRVRLEGRPPEAVVAFGAEGRDTTARALLSDAHAIAEALGPSRGGTAVVVLCRDRARFAAALLGAWEAGHAVALPPNPQPETVRAVRRAEGVLTVLHDGEGERGLDVRPFLDRRGVSPEPLRPLAADRVLLTLYTSGSTGTPRPVPKTGAQVLGEATALLVAFPELRDARVLPVPPPHHIYGLLFGVLAPLLGTGAFHRGPVGDAGGLAAALRAARADVLVSVPAHLRTVAALEGAALPALRRVFSSGAALPAETAAALAQVAGWTITEVLGSSETGGLAHRPRTDAPAPPWTPFPGVRVAADDEGRLLVDSPWLPADAPRPHRGGDRVAVRADGRFEHLGRVDGVLKIGGTRVSVAEIEARLLSIEGVLDAAVLPVEVGGARGFETWAAVVAPGLDAAALRAALRRWVAPVAVPRRFRFLEALPRAAHGKLERRALLALFEAPPAPRAAPGDAAGASAPGPAGAQDAEEPTR